MKIGKEWSNLVKPEQNNFYLRIILLRLRDNIKWGGLTQQIILYTHQLGVEPWTRCLKSQAIYQLC